MYIIKQLKRPIGYLDKDVEILTLRGWKKHHELKNKTIVYTYDLLSHKIKPIICEEFRLAKYNGNMIRVLGDTTDILLFEQTRLLIISKGKIQVIKVNDLIRESSLDLRVFYTPSFTIPDISNSIKMQNMEWRESRINTVERINYNGNIWIPKMETDVFLTRRNGHVNLNTKQTVSSVNSVNKKDACFNGKTNVIYRTTNGNINCLSLSELFLKERFTQIELLHRGQWIHARPVQKQHDSKWLLVHLSNGVTLWTTDSQKFKTQRGIVRSDEMQIEDILRCDLEKVECHGGCDSYHLGLIIGMMSLKRERMLPNLEDILHEFKIEIDSAYLNTFATALREGDELLDIEEKFINNHNTICGCSIKHLFTFSSSCLQGVWGAWFGMGDRQIASVSVTSEVLAHQILLIGRLLGHACVLESDETPVDKPNLFTISQVDPSSGPSYLVEDDNTTYVSVSKISIAIDNSPLCYTFHKEDGERFQFEVENGILAYGR